MSDETWGGWDWAKYVVPIQQLDLPGGWLTRPVTDEAASLTPDVLEAGAERAREGWSLGGGFGGLSMDEIRRRFPSAAPASDEAPEGFRWQYAVAGPGRGIEGVILWDSLAEARAVVEKYRSAGRLYEVRRRLVGDWELVP